MIAESVNSAATLSLANPITQRSVREISRGHSSHRARRMETHQDARQPSAVQALDQARHGDPGGQAQFACAPRHAYQQVESSSRPQDGQEGAHDATCGDRGKISVPYRRGGIKPTLAEALRKTSGRTSNAKRTLGSLIYPPGARGCGGQWSRSSSFQMLLMRKKLKRSIGSILSRASGAVRGYAKNGLKPSEFFGCVGQAVTEIISNGNPLAEQ
jgi:hypothetical protein